MRLSGPGDTLRIIPCCSNRFAYVQDPEFDSEIGLPGHSTCPSGRTIDFE